MSSRQRLRRVMAKAAAEDDRGRRARSLAAARIVAAAAAEARLRVVAGRADGLEFRAGLAARRGARRRGRARHLDRTVELRHAHRDRSRPGAGRGAPTMRAPTYSMSMRGYAHDDDHDDAGSLLALAADRLARAQPVLHRHDRLARGAPLRRCRRSRPRPSARAPQRRASSGWRRRCRPPMPRSCARRFGRARPQPKSARDALNRAFERIQGALRAEPFDPAQLRAALAEVRTARPVYEQVMQEILLDAARARCRPRAAQQARRLAAIARPATTHALSVEDRTSMRSQARTRPARRAVRVRARLRSRRCCRAAC